MADQTVAVVGKGNFAAQVERVFQNLHAASAVLQPTW